MSPAHHICYSIQYMEREHTFPKNHYWDAGVQLKHQIAVEGNLVCVVCTAACSNLPKKTPTSDGKSWSSHSLQEPAGEGRDLVRFLKEIPTIVFSTLRIPGQPELLPETSGCQIQAHQGHQSIILAISVSSSPSM